MTTTEIKITGTQKRIDKLTAKISRLNGLIAKKKARIASGKEEGKKYANGNYILDVEIRWHEEDIKRAKKDLVIENDMLRRYKDKQRLDEERDATLPNVRAVEAFLANWAVQATEWYKNQITSLDKYVIVQPSTMSNSELIKNILLRYSREVFNIWDKYNTDVEVNQQIEKLVTAEVVRKRADLYCRCSEAIGVITDASGLSVGDNLSLNGLVIGERGKAKVETIYAGGHNIQCLHYRVLISKLS